MSTIFYDKSNNEISNCNLINRDGRTDKHKQYAPSTFSKLRAYKYLLLTGLSKFSEKSENYMVWKMTYA